MDLGIRGEIGVTSLTTTSRDPVGENLCFIFMKIRGVFGSFGSQRKNASNLVFSTFYSASSRGCTPSLKTCRSRDPKARRRRNHQFEGEVVMCPDHQEKTELLLLTGYDWHVGHPFACLSGIIPLPILDGK